jgi:hypothetical protein
MSFIDQVTEDSPSISHGNWLSYQEGHCITHLQASDLFAKLVYIQDGSLFSVDREAFLTLTETGAAPEAKSFAPGQARKVHDLGSEATCMRMSPAGSVLLLATEDMQILGFSVEEKAKISEFQFPRPASAFGLISQILFGPGKSVFVGTEGGCVGKVDFEKGEINVILEPGRRSC